MLLTMPQPPRIDFGARPTHEFSPPRSSFPKLRESPPLLPRVDSPVRSLANGPIGTAPELHMSGSHRGLPPPSAMTLPDPGRPPQSSYGQPLGPMPAPPGQWQGQEDAMTKWLTAKAEEDKRKQEEEKTRQESFRLEQRKIEQAMLRESLQAGVPPTIIPLIYAGMGGSNLSHASIDWLYQYAGQLQGQQQYLVQQQQQSQQASPESRRPGENRVMGPISAPPQQQQLLPALNVDQAGQSGGTMQTTFPAFPPAAAIRGTTSAPRPVNQAQLPRLTTNDAFVNQPSQHGLPSGHPSHQGQALQQDQGQGPSPSIYFHHWVPPNESKNPQTPATKGEQQSGHSHSHSTSHLTDSDHRDSPKKRKAQGGHQANPPPQTSPPFSPASSASGRKFGHARNQSTASTAKDSAILSRPESRREPAELLARFSQPSQPDSGHVSEASSRPPDSAEPARERVAAKNEVEKDT